MSKKKYYFDMVVGRKYLDEDDDGEDIIEQGSTTFYIVPKSHYDSTGYLSDSVGRELNSILFPLGFHEQAEAMYGYNGEDEEGRQKLISLGLIEKELGFDVEF